MIDFPFPETMRVHVAENRPSAAIDKFSLTDHITFVGSKQLADLVIPGMDVTIAFTDATRACPDEQLVGWLLDKLVNLGVDPANVTLICATGLHRPINQSELVKKLGGGILSRFRMVNNAALDPVSLVDLGDIDGYPVITNRHCVETDLLLATGVVEPHQYAGYSGGAKTVVIGCGGEQRFFDILSQADSPAQLIETLRQTGFPAGAQRAYVLAQVLVRHPVIVVGAEHPDVVEACHMHAVPDMAQGLALAEKLARQHFALPSPNLLDFLVVPQALLTLPRLVL